jgi:hypothetical protein
MGYGAELLADHAYEIHNSQREDVCGQCRWNRYDDDGFYCGCKESDYYGHSTMYSDSCDEWKEKE